LLPQKQEQKRQMSAMKLQKNNLRVITGEVLKGISLSLCIKIVLR